MDFEEVKNINEEKIYGSTNANTFKKEVRNRVQGKKSLDLIKKQQSMSLIDVKKLTQKINDKWADRKSATINDVRDVRDAMEGRSGKLTKVNNELAQAISKNIINKEVNKISKPEQSNYQERYLNGRFNSKVGVVKKESNSLPESFYVNFTNGTIKPKGASGFGLDGLVINKRKVYFVENKIAEFTRQTDGSILRFINSSVESKATPIFVCGDEIIKYKKSLADALEVSYDEKDLPNRYDFGKYYIMSPAQFHKWCSTNGIKSLKVSKGETNEYGKLKGDSVTFKQLTNMGILAGKIRF